MHVRKHSFTCSLQLWLYMEFHSNRLLLLVDTSPETKILGHILTYIYQKLKTFSKWYHNEPKLLEKGINSAELHELSRVCNAYLLSRSSSRWYFYFHSYVLTIYVRLYWILKLLVLYSLVRRGTYTRLVYNWYRFFFTRLQYWQYFMQQTK